MSALRRVVIIGCGGHGRVLGDILLSQPESFELIGFVDKNPELTGGHIFGVRVLGDDDFLKRGFGPA
ncbi:MAG: hypothetical protein LBO21_10315, partial [Synergistaceae bacterium]|nr:hypothetical protein [Synergistaceae bacterium]